MKWTDRQLRLKQKTLDLNQAAGDYNLFIGAGQEVFIESLIVKMPNDDAGGALTFISIHTDELTPFTFISAVDGAVAYLTIGAQLGWVSQSVPMILNVGRAIVLTIGGGAHGSEYLVEITVNWRPVKSGGYLILGVGPA